MPPLILAARLLRPKPHRQFSRFRLSSRPLINSLCSHPANDATPRARTRRATHPRRRSSIVFLQGRETAAPVAMSFAIEVPGETNPLSFQTLCRALESATSHDFAQRQAAGQQLTSWEQHPGYYSSLQVCFCASR